MSQRENAIGAVFALLGQLTLGTTVIRNAALPERIADHAMAILRDGEMGEPEVSLSPLTYHWQHQWPSNCLSLIRIPLRVMHAWTVFWSSWRP